MLIYQFSAGGKVVVVDGIGWRFPLLAILNSVSALKLSVMNCRA